MLLYKWLPSTPLRARCFTAWENDAHLGVAGPIIVDGAKRDRYVDLINLIDEFI